MGESETRRCTRCLRVKPTSEFYRQGRKPDGSDRLMARCKQCTKNYQRRHHEERRTPGSPRRHTRLNAAGDVWCGRCKTFLRPDNFRPHPSRPGTLWAYCRECTRAIDRDRYARKFSDDAVWAAELKRRNIVRRRRRAADQVSRRRFVGNGVAILRGRGFTKAEIARMLGVASQTLNAWEREAVTPQPQAEGRVAEALRLTAEMPGGEPLPPRGRRRPHPAMPALLESMRPAWERFPLRNRHRNGGTA